ncbi:MAG: hypothetical protein H6739_17175 [Alphaproteobacteria bacterium]|nr:hypothetical protein [Alphaproteobacteria bacterium]
MSWLVTALALLAAGALVPVGVGFCVLAVERGRPIRLTRAGISVFAREWAAHAVAGPMLPLGVVQLAPAPFGPRDDPPDAPTPVVLVPGYAMNRACMFVLASYLRRRGWRWVWPVNHRPHSGGLHRFAQQLGASVDRVRMVSGAEQVDLVCHSMGGVVAGLYLREYGGAVKVRRLVTLGTPWKGSRMGVFGLRQEAVEMLPTGDVVQRLDGLPVPAVAIASDTDHMVIPPDSATPPWIRVVRLDHVGHLEMLSNARVLRLVRDLLADERFALPEAS